VWAMHTAMILPQQKGEDRNSESRKSWFSDVAFIVFVATVSAYAYTYFYEIGWCSAVGVPWQFISLDGRDIMVDLWQQLLIWLLVPCLFLLLVFDLWYLYSDSPFTKTRLDRWKVAIKTLSDRWNVENAPQRILVLITFSLTFAVVRYEHQLMSFTIMFFVGAIVFFTPAIVLERSLHMLDFLFAWIAFLVLSFYIGARISKSQTDYLALASSPSTVVLRVYGNKLITARLLDTNTGAVENKFKVLDSVDTEMRWESMKIPLHVQK
jgi:hypothetical protein